MDATKASYYRRAVVAQLAVTIACFAVYCILPLMRHGIRFESDADSAVSIARSATNLSSSDMLLMLSNNALTVTILNPDLMRRLENAAIKIDATRDLPGILPIVLLTGIAASAWRYLRKRKPIQESTIFRVLSLTCTCCAAVVFYMWYWTGAASHDPVGALVDPLQREQWRGTSRDLSYWYLSLQIVMPIWLIATIFFRRFLKDFLTSRLMPVFVQGFFIMSLLATMVMFPPRLYGRYIALGWWPLLFCFALLSCNLVCTYGLRRLDLDATGVRA